MPLLSSGCRATVESLSSVHSSSSGRATSLDVNFLNSTFYSVPVNHHLDLETSTQTAFLGLSKPPIFLQCKKPQAFSLCFFILRAPKTGGAKGLQSFLHTLISPTRNQFVILATQHSPRSLGNQLHYQAQSYVCSALLLLGHH